MALGTYLVLFTIFAQVFGQSLDKGLTNKERQYMLDLHNYLRFRVATGGESNQPPADFMLAMEWDDRLEQRAQEWADRCPTYHSDMNSRYRKFQPFDSTGENRVDGLLYADFRKSIKVGWYDEYKDYQYGSNYCSKSMCGHYTQVVWQNSTLLGCGWNRCVNERNPALSHPVMFCHYGPSGNIYNVGTTTARRPYKKAARGAQCRKCPMGFERCMNKGLCASASACRGTKSTCTCTISSCKNGGQFDSVGCRCKCPSGWEGVHCERPCKDTFEWCHLSSNKAGCSWESLKHEWATTVCRKTCGACGYFLDKDTGKSNKHGIKSNAFPKEPKSPPRKGSPKPGGPKCPNKAGDEKCNNWALGGQCQANARWMIKNCAMACNKCPVCKNKQKDSDCGPWAASGECRKNAKWMKKNCAKSCNACG